jgi:hypothetical protein
MSLLGKKSKHQVDVFKKRVSDLKELKQKIERLNRILNEKTKILKSQSCEYGVRLSSKFDVIDIQEEIDDRRMVEILIETERCRKLKNEGEQDKITALIAQREQQEEARKEDILDVIEYMRKHQVSQGGTKNQSNISSIKIETVPKPQQHDMITSTRALEFLGMDESQFAYDEDIYDDDMKFLEPTLSLQHEITNLLSDSVISDAMQYHKSYRNQACPFPDVEPSTSLQAENFQTDHGQLSPRTTRRKAASKQTLKLVSRKMLSPANNITNLKRIIKRKK